MRNWLIALATVAFASIPARAQMPNFGDVPVEINAENQRFEGGVAIADGNVEVIYGPTTIYADYVQYNPDTRDVLAIGNVRIYREGRTFLSERALYNMETKQIHASDVRGEFYPFEFSADSLLSIGNGAMQANDAIFTTSDSAKPDYHLSAKTVRIYPRDRIVMSNVTVYVGKVPVFWYPYLYQSLDKDQSFTYTPGYQSSMGATLLTQYTFPIAPNVSGQVRLDLRSQRGIAVGFNSDFKFGPDNKSWGKFITYYTDDLAPGTNPTALARVPIGSERYRVSLQERLYVTDDIYANIDVTKLSDPLLMQDFFPGENRLNPQPDNVISLTKLGEDYTLTGIARKQLNTFQDTTERLPELDLDVKRHAIFDSPIFYEGETSASRLQRTLATGVTLSGYSATRFDTYHELLLPQTYFDWLSFVPRVGGRLTYYTDTGGYQNETVADQAALASLLPGEVPPTTSKTVLVKQGAALRTIIDAGFESSFKLSRAYENVESRLWGLDGLRHVIQPYTDFEYVNASKSPSGILQFDRLNPSEQLPPLEFPAFNAIDSIPSSTILRLGVRNRLETRRDGHTIQWFTMDTYINWNIQEPIFPGINYREGSFSNLINRVTFSPVPALRITGDQQFPLLPTGFSEYNTNVTVQANQDLSFTLGHRYIYGNPFFPDSSLIQFGTYYRINDNWGFSIAEQYEMADHTLEQQTYQIHRDLSSWIATFGLLFRNNATSTVASKTEFGFMITFTLKDLPQISIPFGESPSTGGNVKGL